MRFPTHITQGALRRLLAYDVIMCTLGLPFNCFAWELLPIKFDRSYTSEETGNIGLALALIAFSLTVTNSALSFGEHSLEAISTELAVFAYALVGQLKLDARPWQRVNIADYLPIATAGLTTISHGDLAKSRHVLELGPVKSISSTSILRR